MRPYADTHDDIATVAVHAGAVPMPTNESAQLPIFQASAWRFASIAQAEAIFNGTEAGASYGTDGVPNLLGLERMLCALEGAEDAVVTSTGCSALLATFLAHLRPGDTVVANRDLFGGTVTILKMLEVWGIETIYVDSGDAAGMTAAIDQRTRVLFAETISNPRIQVADIPAYAGIARARGVLLVVDNTFATPFHARPLDMGADIVIESVTKALSGHLDVLLGAVAGRKELLDPVRRFVTRGGMTASAMHAWLATRGIASFPLRQERASSNAALIARWLEAQPRVATLNYPGLDAHPNRAVADRVLRLGYGSVLSFSVESDRSGIDRFLGGLRLIHLVHSLAGPSTTLSHSATMTHRAMDPELRASMGITDGFLRLSVGLEAASDIIEDLRRGFAALGSEATA